METKYFLSFLVLFIIGFAVISTGSVFACTYHSYQQCNGSYLYWYDSCGNMQDVAQYCTNGCFNNVCQYDNYNYNYNNYAGCSYHAYQQCSGNSLYWYNSCGQQQDLIQYCQNGCYNNSCQNNNYNYNYYGNCSYHAYQQCSGSYLYWYDSCGNMQDVAQHCTGGCYNNVCSTNNYNYGDSCTYHAYKLCVGSNVYWYSGCGQQQDLYLACPSGQVCSNPAQYGQCSAPYIQPAPNPSPAYVAHYKTACQANSLYWYDSLGAQSGLYKDCVDSNSCTADSCSGNKCQNTLKCEGSTCAVSSADYNTYCLSAQSGPTTPANTHCGNGLCEATLGETSVNCSSDCKINTSSQVAVSFFVKTDANSGQWQKTAQVGPDGQVFFMISVTNNSTSQADNLSVSANIPSEISSLGNMQLNGVPISGDIVSGVNIGSMSAASNKSLTFEGKTQTIPESSTKQATASVVLSGATQTDTVSIVFNPGEEAPAAVSSASSTFGFSAFLARWYIWIIVGLVLMILFIVVFRRLSSDV